MLRVLRAFEGELVLGLCQNQWHLISTEYECLLLAAHSLQTIALSSPVSYYV